MSEVEDEEPEGSGCAGAALVTVVILGTAIALYAVAPEVFVLGMWAVGWGALIVAAKRVPPAPNPAPPPAPEGAVEEESQFSVVPDPEHPHHSLIRWIKEAGMK